MRKMHWLIIYDISDDKRLNKVRKTIVKYAHRVQLSVYEMYASEKTLEELRLEIKDIIEEEEDYVVYFKLCERDWQNRLKFGLAKGNEADDSEVIIL